MLLNTTRNALTPGNSTVYFLLEILRKMRHPGKILHWIYIFFCCNALSDALHTLIQPLQDKSQTEQDNANDISSHTSSSFEHEVRTPELSAPFETKINYS